MPSRKKETPFGGGDMAEITRRSVLAGTVAVTAGALGPLAGGSPAHAAAPPAGKQAAAFYRYKIGTYEVTVVSDGGRTFPLPETFVINKKKDEVNEALAAAYMPKDK